MTISSQSRKAGPFTGNGSTIAFPFAFKVFVASDVYVVRANTSGVETVLTSGTDYSVTLNSNQNSNPGGTVTLSAALATNFKLVITSAVPNLQPVDITNNGGFYPKVINDALDRVTIMAQQIAEEAGRGIKLPITSSLTSDQFTEQLFDARDEAVTSASNAATSASAAAASATSASGSATTATTKASEASTSASGAASSATAASGSATAAAGSATTAGNSATTATNKANEAASSATAAAASATAAAGSATTATNKAGEATTAAAAAAGSQTAAAASASAAGTSATNASNSATSASNSATSAASSASAASTSASQAGTSATTATTKASEASTSATNAAGSAASAASSASNASASATSATNSAAAAASSETNASSSASNAAASAAAAATALDNFDDRYLGSKANPPTVDNDGNTLVTGALYYNDGTVMLDNKGMWIWDGVQWIKASAATQAILVTYEYLATAGQTTFSGNDANGVPLAYTVGSIIVSLNGVKLRPGNDFTASNGTSVVLVTGAAAGDDLVIDAFSTFDVANMYTKAEADALLSGKQAASTTLTSYSSNGIGFKNRIINGDMRIDQRNAGAAVTVNTAGAFYPTDRFRLSGGAASGVFTGQQVSDAPESFVNSLKITVTTSSASGDYYIAQPIEGNNISDLDFGKATAKAVTISFWVKSSLTGTFAGSLVNEAVNRSYAYTYTISSANTWEKKSVTIAGDTSGSWWTDNRTGIRAYFSLGCSGLKGAAGSWASAFYIGATGETPVIGTNGATFYITGVQLEAGTVATPFERRAYGTELALCQRYCVNYRAADSNGNYYRYAYGECTVATAFSSNITFPVAMRAIPSLTTSATAAQYCVYSRTTATALSVVPTIGSDGSSTFTANLNGSTSGGLTQGSAGALMSNNNQLSGLLFTAEL